jgi:hypothetical protein
MKRTCMTYELQVWLCRQRRIAKLHSFGIFNLSSFWYIVSIKLGTRALVIYIREHIFLKGLSWSWSYCSWIYNYLCNQCLSLITLWVRIPFMAKCTRYSIMWSSLSVTCDRSVVFSTNKTDHHDITEILLKVALSSVTLISSFVTNPPATTKLRNN